MPHSPVALVWAPPRVYRKALVNDILDLRAREHWVLNHGGRSQSLGRRALVQVSQPWLPCLAYLAQLIELVFRGAISRRRADSATGSSPQPGSAATAATAARMMSHAGSLDGVCSAAGRCPRRERRGRLTLQGECTPSSWARVHPTCVSGRQRRVQQCGVASFSRSISALERQ